MSELKTNKVSPATGTALAVGDSGDTITVPSGATLDISASTLTPPATMPASSGVNLTALSATNLGSGTVPSARLEADIALLAFKTQANGSLAKYGLLDQVVDSFEDTSGIDLSGSTNEIRNTGNYIIGGTVGTSTTVKLTSGTSWTVPAGVYNGEVLAVAGGGGGGSL